MGISGGIKFDKVVIDCPEPKELAAFYASLLGWQVGYDTEDFVIIGSESSNVDMGFQRNEDYVPPVWPEEEGAQQQMLHIDLAIQREDMPDWVERAKALGARVAATQFSDAWTVMLDPQGHPFCFDAC